MAPLASDPDVQDAVAFRLEEVIFSYIDIDAATDELVSALTAQGLPERAAALLVASARPLANGVRSFVSDKIHEFVASDAFEAAWIEANRQAHSSLVAALTGEGDDGAVTIERGTVTIGLATIINTVKQQLVDSGFELAARIPEVNATFTILQSDDLSTVQQVIGLVDDLSTWLPVVGLILLGVAVGIARDRRRVLLAAGIAVAASMLLLGAALNVIRPIYLDALPVEASQAAAGAIYDQLVSFIRIALRGLLVVAITVAVIAWLSSPRGSGAARPAPDSGPGHRGPSPRHRPGRPGHRSLRRGPRPLQGPHPGRRPGRSGSRVPLGRPPDRRHRPRLRGRTGHRLVPPGAAGQRSGRRHLGRAERRGARDELRRPRVTTAGKCARPWRRFRRTRKRGPRSTSRWVSSASPSGPASPCCAASPTSRCCARARSGVRRSSRQASSLPPSRPGWSGAAPRTAPGRVREVGALVDQWTPVIVELLVSRVDLTSLVLRHLDIDRVVAAADLDAAVANVDLDAVVSGVDLNAAVKGVDIDAIAGRLDIEAVLARVDLVAMVEDVLAAIDLPAIIRDSSGSMASETVRGARMTGITVDDAISRAIERHVFRGRRTPRADSQVDAEQ